MDRIYGILFGLAGTALFVFIRWYALKTGEAPGRGGSAHREKNPAIFRAAIIMYSVLDGLSAVRTIGFSLGLLPLQP